MRRGKKRVEQLRLARYGFGNNDGKDSNGAHLISLALSGSSGRPSDVPVAWAKGAHGVSFGFGTYLRPIPVPERVEEKAIVSLCRVFSMGRYLLSPMYPMARHR